MSDMPCRASDDRVGEPATLFRVMQTAVGDGLRERYEPLGKMSHQLFVLMMQINDRARREPATEVAQKRRGKADRRRAPAPAKAKVPHQRLEISK